MWRAEDILDWTVERVGERNVLVRLVLRDGDRVGVLKVVEGGCVMEEWRRADQDGQAPIADSQAPRADSQSPIGNGQGEDWVVVERACLKRDGVLLPLIPFVFHGSRHSRPEPDRLPLADIIAANLDHYRLDADYRHGLHFAALPTAWVSGFDKATALRIGSSAARRRMVALFEVPRRSRLAMA